MTVAKAMIFQTGVLRTQALPHRPSPTLFFFPGLQSMPVWDYALCEKRFPWFPIIQQPDVVAKLREEHDELVRVVPNDYSTRDESRDGGEHKMHTGDWSWRTYVSKGKRKESFAAACPHTAGLLDNVVGSDLMTDTPFSFAFFSTLHGESAIAPHAAPCNLRLRVHLPLSTPPGAGVDECGMRVGAVQCAWNVGESVIFDDSYEHETWNKTRTDRVVLLFDVWHPDLSLAERLAIVEMFDSMKK